MIEHYATPSAAACFNRAHHSGSARPEDYDIHLLHVLSVALLFE
jgi:hypothetical protein